MSTKLTPEIPTGTVKVEIAWNYPTSSTYTDITSDVRMDPGLSWRIGRGDESARSSPAELKFKVKNTANKYSFGGTSANYPSTQKKNRPIRVTMDPADGSGGRVTFHGYSTGLTPGWDSADGGIPIVNVSASGSLRRIKQGNGTVIAPLRRWYETQSADLIAYWACEVGQYATLIPDAIASNVGDMTWTGTADLASCEDFPLASFPLPRMSNAQFWGAAGTVTLSADKSQSFRALVSFPESGSAPADGTILFRTALTGGTIWTFQIQYKTGGSLKVEVFDSGSLGSTTGAFNIDGKKGLLSLEMYQSGGTVFYGLNWLELGATTYSSLAGSPSVSGTLGQMYGVEVNYAAVNKDVGFGHLSLWKTRSATDPVTDFYQALNGYPGELIPETTGRIQRVCNNNSISLTFYDTAETDYGFNDYAGPVGIGEALDIIYECEDVERGFLWDGLSLGLSYTTRRKMEGSVAALTIDAGAKQLSPPFEPVDDDQRIKNQWTVNRKEGAEYTIKDDASVTEAGLYSDTLEVNTYSDYGARNLADWLVYQGTIKGYRYPTVTIDLRANPSLAGGVLNLYPGARIDITNLADALSSIEDVPVELIVEGIAHEYSEYSWTVTLTCSRADAWDTMTLASTSGDTAESLGRIQEKTGVVVRIAAAAGATTLHVLQSLSTDPLITTVADDYPMNLMVDGVLVRATACSGVTTSAQSFTVDPLPKAMSINDVVTFPSNVLGL